MPLSHLSLHLLPRMTSVCCTQLYWSGSVQTKSDICEKTRNPLINGFCHVARVLHPQCVLPSSLPPKNPSCRLCIPAHCHWPSLFLSSVWVYAREPLYVWLMTLFLQMLVFGDGPFSSSATITSFSSTPSFLTFSFHSPLSSSHLSLSSFPQSFLVLRSQHLSGPLGPVLLMTYPETVKGTQEWNCGVTGRNTKAAINKPLRCEIVRATPNNDGEETCGDPGVTDQRVSFFVGWAGGICDKGASFCWSLSSC